MDITELKKLRTRASELNCELQKIPVIAEILSKLKEGLSPDLYYHNYEHTTEVMEEAIIFALHDNLPERDIELISIAAAYHDAGFLFRREENEQIAAKMAFDALKKSGAYVDDEIKLVCEMIADTKVLLVDHQFTRLVSNNLSKYLLDADLGNLGSEDFFMKNKLILRETGIEEKVFSRLSLSLLKNHRWLSPAGMALKEAQRLKNLEVLLGAKDQ